MPTESRYITGDLTVLGAIKGTTRAADKWTNPRQISLAGDLSGSATFDGSADFSLTATIANASVTLAKMANLATASLLGRSSAGTGQPEVLSAATVRAMLVSAGTGVSIDGSGAISIGQAVAPTSNPTFANLTVTGNLTVNGTTTTTNSDSLTVDDPTIMLGGDTAPTSDDGKDRGVEFRWHNGSAAKLGFFGFDRSTQKLVFIPDATDTAGVFTGTKGTLDAQIAWDDVTGKPAVWHSGNDGAGSTLDADLLDGQQGAYYTSPVNHSLPTSLALSYDAVATPLTHYLGTVGDALAFRPIQQLEYWNGSAWVAWTPDPGVQTLLTGRACSAGISITPTYRKWRFVVQTDSYLGAVILALHQSWNNGAHQVAVTLERAATSTGTWSTVIAETLSPSGENNYRFFVRAADHSADTWHRVTVESKDTTNNTTYTGLQLLYSYTRASTMPSGNPLLPFSWDWQRNITSPGKINVTGSTSADDALRTTAGRLQLGQTTGGAGIWFDRSSGTKRWFLGLNGADSDEFRIYSLTAAANVLSITPTGAFTITGAAQATRFVSTVATGTSPVAVTSTTACTNLNADLLDGLHASAFALAGHAHAWADITGKPSTFAPSAHTHLWADLTDKPATFSPSTHTHLWSDVTDKPTTFTPSAHTHLWADITDKPSTYTPSAHDHHSVYLRLDGANSMAGAIWVSNVDPRLVLTETDAAADGKRADFIHQGGALWGRLYNDAGTQLYNWLQVSRTGKDAVSIDLASTTNFRWNGSKVWTAGNDGSGSGLDADLLDGLQASAFALASHSHDWASITGKPSTFAPSSHTHPWADITGAPGTYAPSAHTHPWAEVTGKPATYPPSAHSHDYLPLTGGTLTGGLTLTGLGADYTTGSSSNRLLVLDPSGVARKATGAWVRGMIDASQVGHTHGWTEITGKPSLYAPSSHTHLWADLTDKPATFTPATHSHPWAEITGKPSYFTPETHQHNWGDITSGRPTTLSGYGITDALALTGGSVSGNLSLGGTLALQNLGADLSSGAGWKVLMRADSGYGVPRDHAGRTVGIH